MYGIKITIKARPAPMTGAMIFVHIHPDTSPRPKPKTAVKEDEAAEINASMFVMN